ncbi:NAD(P)H-hydrate dehydratase [uncultured Ruminococcus sp.]|uniref:NAD(P)H-hydrate dehydratase n=1 Tax=uncultured Ruminococcus sp. TaxID=165186 RepID=UPI00292D9E26|nr:NAD(P)H-hydrate dehydratase [uncultured Ruminococcus sp.]
MKQVDFNYLVRHFPDRPDNAHKGTMGTLCSLTGSRGFSGAAILSAQAALRTGVGLHYQLIPDCIYPIFASSVYESVCVPLTGGRDTVCPADLDAIHTALQKATAVLLGCGLGLNDDTRTVVFNLIRSCEKPLIIDADGINALSGHIHILEERKAPVILTPHVKEFSRISGLSVEDILQAPAEAARSFASAHENTVLVLKGHRTYIAQNDRLYENTAGNSGMAKGGSGDMLAGIVSSLAAQGAEAFDAAVMGVHIHALAGDLAAKRLSRTAILPSDIICTLSEVYSMIEDSKNNA